jgi:hypothetical protein
MIGFRQIAAGLVLAGLACAAHAAETGSWTIGPSKDAGMVDFLVHQGHSISSSDWKIDAFKGLDLAPAKHEVHFTIERDAGRLEGDGIFADGNGAGTLHFTPTPDYADALDRLGLGRIAADDQLTYALHDVSLKFAGDMAGAGIAGLNAGKLLMFRIQGVTPDYIAGLKAHGMKDLTADQLVAMRIHHID